MSTSKYPLHQHYDDSSDEDDLSDGITRKVSKDIDKAKKDPFIAPRIESFINHTYGLMIYNSSKVKSAYRKLKGEVLSGGGEVPSYEVLADWIHKGIRTSISQQLGLERHSKASDALAALCIKAIDREINDFIKTCLKQERQVIRSIKHKKPLPEAVIRQLGDINKLVQEFAKDKKNYIDLDSNRFDNVFDAPILATAENLLDIRVIKSWVESECLKELNEIDAVANRVINNGFENVKILIITDKGKLKRGHEAQLYCDQILTRYEGELTDIQKEYIRKLKTRTSNVAPDNFTYDFKLEILSRKLNELINEEEKRGKYSIFYDKEAKGYKRYIVCPENLEGSRFKPIAEYLRKFIPCNGHIFWQMRQEAGIESINISEPFIQALEKNYEKKVNPMFFRKTLPTLYKHTVRSCVDYIASLRLTNRSTVRTKRNQEIRDSILGGSKETNHSFVWEFPASSEYMATENTNVTGNARNGFVTFPLKLSSYPALAAAISKIKEQPYEINGRRIKINDQDIAHWVRRVMQCRELIFSPYGLDKIIIPFSAKEKNDMSEFIVNLAHLLGGTEAMRYPGALVQSQMALDLIIGGQLSLEEAFNPNKKGGMFIPITMKSVVPISRELTGAYCEVVTDYTHTYPGVKKGIKEAKDGTKVATKELNDFVEAEARLAKSWVKFVKSKDRSCKDLQTALDRSINSWYPDI